ncbi:MAG: hypothetical protein NVS3B26_18290 [Mycobacteriales bacterium]
MLAASNGGVLHALDPRTGRDRWTYDGGGSYGSDLSTSPAVLGDGSILWPGPGHTLRLLSEKGKVLWSQVHGGFVLSPAVVGRRAYIADMSGKLLALDLPSGRQPHVAWRRQLQAGSYSSPAVSPDGTVYTAAGTLVTALSDQGDSARVRWTFRTRDTVEVSPAVTEDGTVIIGTNADVQYGLGPDGSVRWTFDRGDWSYSSPVARDGKVWFGSHLGQVDVLDGRSGRLDHRDLALPKSQGKSSDGVGVWTAPLVDAHQDVYFGTAAGHIYGFDPGGRRLWDVDVGAVVASYPALTSDGTLLIGSSNGWLYAFADQPGSAHA